MGHPPTTYRTKQEAVQRHCGWDVPPPPTEPNKKQCRDTVGGTSPHHLQNQTRSSAETLWVRRPPPAACKQEAVQRHCGCNVPPQITCRTKQDAVQRHCGCHVPPEPNKKQYRDTGCDVSPNHLQNQTRSSTEKLWVGRPPLIKVWRT